MTTTNLKIIEALETFLNGNQRVAFAVLGDKLQRYDFVRSTRVKFSYLYLPKKDKAVVIQYLIKMTGYSRQQLTRLIQKYTKMRKINWKPCRSNGFSKIYTHQGIMLLAKTDELHDTPCGQAFKKICERAFDAADSGLWALFIDVLGIIEQEKKDLSLKLTAKDHHIVSK